VHDYVGNTTVISFIHHKDFRSRVGQAPWNDQPLICPQFPPFTGACQKVPTLKSVCRPKGPHPEKSTASNPPQCPEVVPPTLGAGAGQRLERLSDYATVGTSNGQTGINPPSRPGVPKKKCAGRQVEQSGQACLLVRITLPPVMLMSLDDTHM
jgi:hypothetical protein